MITPVKGFSSNFQIKVILTSNCASIEGLAFILHEVDNDFYIQKDIPQIVQDIDAYYKNASLASNFLTNELQIPQLNQYVSSFHRQLYTSDITPQNKANYVTSIHQAINNVLKFFYANPLSQQLPVAYKQKMNILVFNSITSKCHFKLMMAYHKAMENQNYSARTKMLRSNFRDSKMDPAVEHLKNILLCETPIEAIEKLTAFYYAVVKALPGVEIAADDILPAICMAMGKDVNLSSKIVSFFEYLCSIWPDHGMDEQTSYILTTCSIAATHLSMEEQTMGTNSSKKNSIALLESILDIL